jgi:hypothetical protein
MGRVQDVHLIPTEVRGAENKDYRDVLKEYFAAFLLPTVELELGVDTK